LKAKLSNHFASETNEITELVHIPTVEHALMILRPSMESERRNFRIHIDHKPSPAERSYFFGLHMLPRIMLHLNTRQDYQVTASNQLHTAIAIFYAYLDTLNLALPFMDIINTFDHEDVVEAYQLPEMEFIDPAEASLYSKLLDSLDFLSAIAGVVDKSVLSTPTML